MLDTETRDAIVQLTSSRMVDLEKGLKNDVGAITADLANRGFSISNLRVVYVKGAGERNLARRAETIKNTIVEVCDSRKIRQSRGLRANLSDLFDQLYEQQLASVRPYIERTIPDEAKKLCPIGEISPEIAMHRVELRLFADRLPQRDYWESVEHWFRSRWWSVPVAVIAVCLPLLAQWVEMFRSLMDWLGVSEAR